MRTENPTSASDLIARARIWLVRLGRSAWARGPVVRLAGAAGAFVLLAVLVYVAGRPSAGKFLNGGQQYSAADVAKITRALDAGGIDYRVENRRIGVATEHFEEAMKVVAPLGLGPRSPGEIRSVKSRDSSLWKTYTEQEKLDLLAKEEILESMIRQLDSVVSAYVTINRTRNRLGVRPVESTTAFVWLETENDRELGPKTVQMIQNIIVGNEPDLKHDAVSVFDKFRHYLDPGNPALNAISRNRAREEELAEKILDQLDWVKHVRVTVQVVPPPVHVVAPTVPVPASPAEVSILPEPKVGVNHGLGGVEPEPMPAPVAVAAVPLPVPPVETGMLRVWVQVPRSFYLLKALPKSAPSFDELQSIVARTESLIKTAVDHVMPPAEKCEIEIGTIPDDVAVAAPPVPPVVPESHRSSSWWIPAAVGGVVASVLLGVGFRVLTTWRPRLVVATEREPSRYTRDSGSEPIRGPSERVRDLIRRDPGAAAGVLHRWIGQGGNRG